MGLFHHRASLAWEWEKTRFSGWRAHTPHHANVAPEPTELTWRRRHTPNYTATTTPAGLQSRLTGVTRACDGNPMGLFHHRASLSWEWEKTRFRGWRALKPHHANAAPEPTELTRRSANTPHVRYHHDSRAPEPTDWRGTLRRPLPPTRVAAARAPGAGCDPRHPRRPAGRRQRLPT